MIQTQLVVSAIRIFKNLRLRNLGTESRRGLLRLVRQYSGVIGTDFA
jgi:hypothetical protein